VFDVCATADSGCSGESGMTAVMINLCFLYPVKHCEKCEPRVCDGCGETGFECLVDKDRITSVAVSGGLPTKFVAQVFACRACKLKGPKGGFPDALSIPRVKQALEEVGRRLAKAREGARNN
jgi:hypothetical protein